MLLVLHLFSCKISYEKYFHQLSCLFYCKNWSNLKIFSVDPDSLPPTPPGRHLVVVGSAIGLVASVDGLVIEAGSLVTLPEPLVLVGSV